jgi:pimeloyl-ACP methyl ester carboxylesterase
MFSKDFFSDLFWLGKSLVFLLMSILSVLAIAAIYSSTWAAAWLTHLLWVGVILTSLLPVFVLAIRSIYSNNWLGVPIIQKPLQNQGRTVGLIFIQGEGIPSERYRPIAQAIQSAAPDLAIWVCIPQFIGDSPIPRETGLVIDQAIRTMQQEGMPQTDNLFFVAHSVGGIAIQKYLKRFPNAAKGQILMGSFLGKWYLSDLDNHGQTIIQYNVPTLTIGGTLDGLARITRIAAAFWYQQINPSQPTDKANFPVVTIDGASHMQFASGEATSYVADFDLKPTIAENAVHQQVGDLVYNFIRAKLPDINSESNLQFLKGGTAANHGQKQYDLTYGQQERHDHRFSHRSPQAVVCPDR